MKKNIIIPFALLCLLSACKDKGRSTNQSNGDLSKQQTETYVDTLTLHLTDFNNETLCNGRLRAVAKSELSFLKNGIVETIYVKEGERVMKGQRIATIDSREQQREVERAEHEVERAQVVLIDKLIGLGYDADMNNVPADVRKRAEVTSGYYTAKYELQSAKQRLADCELTAPFSGRVANIIAHAGQMSEKVCTIIDDSQFDVEFKVLEAELPRVKVGYVVKVSPFVDSSLTVNGTITEVNPAVDEKGLIKVVARISGGNKELIDGLNMRVVIEQKTEKMFVVPKDAVVERDGYHVAFLYRNGQAVWTYVDIVHSNISSFAITGCKRKGTTIHDGDIIITSGNLNLADGTEVKVYL